MSIEGQRFGVDTTTGVSGLAWQKVASCAGAQGARSRWFDHTALTYAEKLNIISLFQNFSPTEYADGVHSHHVDRVNAMDMFFPDRVGNVQIMAMARRRLAARPVHRLINLIAA